MILGIEASNIRAGGGITHLKELLNAYDPSKYAFKKIIVWAGSVALKELPDATWLEKRTHSFLDKNIFFRLFWQKFIANREISSSGIDVLFVPGAMHYLSFQPLITMSHNMLPFDVKERNRYGRSYMKYRLQLLEGKQGSAFISAAGVVFLTNYAKNAITARLNGTVKSSAVIAHGISPVFFKEPKPQYSIKEYSVAKPFEILYVSIIDVYKHQKSLVPVCVRLYKEGYPIKLKLIGPEYTPERKLLNEQINLHDPKGLVIDMVGSIPYQQLSKAYHSADMFVFASTLENLPNILIEAMASGLPIACSNYGPMPEVLKDAGEYFNPEDQESIYLALKKMIVDEKLRELYSHKSYTLSKQYSWNKCADETFKYLNTFVK